MKTYSKQISDTAREVFSTDSIPKLKRTKVEFVKVEDSIWHLGSDFRAGDLFAFDGQDNYVQIETEGDFTLSHSVNNLYRRVETQITEREAFIDSISEFLDCKEYEIELGKAFDSGKFKLVN